MISILVKAEWDADASVWVASSDDVPGLAAESDSLEKLRPKVLAMIGDLMDEGVVSFDLAAIPVHFVTHSVDLLENSRAA